jgi:hypothetical protein
MIARWAAYFGVDVGRFYRPTSFTPETTPVNYWTDAEKQMLKEKLAAGESTHKIAAELGRTEPSVQYMRRSLQLDAE